MRRTNYGACIVCGEAPKKTKGMCGTHYQMHMDGRGDYSRLIALWEIGNEYTTTKNKRQYEAALKGVVRNTGVSKKTREDFVSHFLDMYGGGR